MRHSFTGLTALVLVFLGTPVLAAAAADHGSHATELGAVEVHANCKPAAMPHLREGLALLHHMTYERAELAFARAADADSACALTSWGRAMSYIHPLWTDPPTDETFRRGEEFVRQAKSLEPSTPEERAYVAAVEAYYREGRSATETQNLAAFADAWKQVHEQYPEDLEAASFHALGLLATANPQDKTFARQMRAAEIAADIRSRVPDHPGAHHYIIHALDYPPLADQALEVARRYSDIAPDVPHALHMPTHIFTRLGLWQDSIEWNARSAAAALKQPVDGAVSMHYLHALDYLAYAHLQLRQDEKAQAVLRTLEALDQPMQVELAVPYTLAAVPARLALERQQWARAASLAPRVPESYPWDRFPAMEAITWFARALGAARLGDMEAAEVAITKLSSLRDAAAKTSTYWAAQVDIQETAAAAWLAYAKGDEAQALELMRKAAQLEASTEKHPVTPGEVLPAAELLGDLLMEFERYPDARVAYEASLVRSPNRYNSLSGAARAAEQEGDAVAAEQYRREVVALAGELR